MDINVSAIWITLLVFAVKLVSVLCICCILNNKKVHGANFAIAWITFYLYEIAMMFALSFAKWLYTRELIIVWGISLLAVIIWLWAHKAKIRYHQMMYMSFSDIIPLTIMVAFCVYCMARAFIYFDTTPDASAYGMPRIFLFSTQGSLFINMDTLSKNIFVNEWNGELNAVFYRILTGNNISIPFANIETYIYAMFSFIFLGKELSKEKRYGIYFAYIVMFLPVVIFLAFTCKGDCLGMVVFPISVLILFCYWKEKRNGINPTNLLYGVIAGGALATGARITLIPAVGLVMLIILFDTLFIEKNYKLAVITVLISAFSYIIGWGRFILNFIFYGNLFERVDVSNETVAPSIDRFFTSLSKYIEDILFGKNIFTHRGVMWALNANAGLLGVFVLVAFIAGMGWLVYRLLHKKELFREYWKELGVAVILILVTGFMLSSMDYFTWSFRYFAPYFICILVLLIYILNYVKNEKVKRICYGTILILGTINAYSAISMATLKGEVTGDTWDNMLQKDEISRRLSFHEWLVENPDGKSDINDFYDDIRENKKVLVCNNIAQIISWCWGDNASNDVTICHPADLKKYYLNDEWDVIVVTNVFDVDQSIIPLYLYEHYEPYGLDFDVYIKKEISEKDFKAENYSTEAASLGVFEFDGEYCWLSQNAVIPIKLDNIAGGGVRVKYAAGLDLKPMNNTDKPSTEIYVNDRKVGKYDVEYTGEYTIYIPQEYFEQEGIYIFRFETNAVTAEGKSIRLKEICPIEEIAYEKGFKAENYSIKDALLGVFEFDGQYCWLDQEAIIPIKISNITQGVQVIYAAGLDLKTTDGSTKPYIQLFVNDKEIGKYDVEYTGEYTICIPQQYFEEEGIYIFRFKINAVVSEHMSIRLKEIWPITEIQDENSDG